MKRSMPSSNLDRFTSRTLGLQPTMRTANTRKAQWKYASLPEGLGPRLEAVADGINKRRAIGSRDPVKAHGWDGLSSCSASQTLREEHAAVQIWLALVS